jgi:putative hydrolase of the HAD superfamily
VVDFFEKSILYFPPAMEPNVEKSLQQLSEKYIIGIISDTGFSPGRIMSQMLEEIDIKKYFSGFSYSDETGVAKPHPKAFTTLLEMFNVAPENALHIGDIEHTDIAGAKKLGMNAIRYDGNEESNLIHAKTNETQADIILKD